MKAAILAGDRFALSAIAAAAVALLAPGIEPPPQTRATVFDQTDHGGRSDAG
jgi:hypothetical protein